MTNSTHSKRTQPHYPRRKSSPFKVRARFRVRVKRMTSPAEGDPFIQKVKSLRPKIAKLCQDSLIRAWKTLRNDAAKSGIIRKNFEFVHRKAEIIRENKNAIHREYRKRKNMKGPKRTLNRLKHFFFYGFPLISLTLGGITAFLIQSVLFTAGIIILSAFLGYAIGFIIRDAFKEYLKNAQKENGIPELTDVPEELKLVLEEMIEVFCRLHEKHLELQQKKYDERTEKRIKDYFHLLDRAINSLEVFFAAFLELYQLNQNSQSMAHECLKKLSFQPEVDQVIRIPQLKAILNASNEILDLNPFEK